MKHLITKCARRPARQRQTHIPKTNPRASRKKYLTKQLAPVPTHRIVRTAHTFDLDRTTQPILI